MRKATGNAWKGHRPVTNCLWLHYLADIILTAKKFACSTDDKHALRGFRYVHVETLCMNTSRT